MAKQMKKRKKKGIYKRDVTGYKNAFRTYLHANGPKPDPVRFGLSPAEADLYEEAVKAED